MTRGLEQLDVLVGDWVVESKKLSEGRGHFSVAPTEDGKFLHVDSREEEKRFPHSTQLVGCDEGRDECTVLYHDDRGVYRVYETTVVDRVWKMWREAPGFNQRFVGKISEDGKTITGQWEMSEDGINWEVDFDLTYRKVDV
jgi:hypothetical protein